ncbi:MAG: sigma-54 dependent transcriptional regulator [Alphaproteobacteria bacterium]|nr:sigma-54 dependent transcriptional regulator [Alphaproteobacteria bacterium]
MESATEAARLRRDYEELRQRSLQWDQLIGDSPHMNNVRHLVERVGPTNSRVLITGPAGAGKELVARKIHAASSRRNGPFIVVNAANIAPERMEIELFGMERQEPGNPGGRKIGVFEQAHGGTLFLDEIGDMPQETQNKILRVLVEQTFERVEGHTKVQVDVRVMSSSSTDLRSLIDEGVFREDLYHRLNVVPVEVPSLTERREDIPQLVDYFMDRLATAHGLSPQPVSEDVIAALQAYEWPGNVRQLRNMVERMLILAKDKALEEIEADVLPQEINGQGGGLLQSVNGAVMSVPLREARESFEREYLKAQIARFGGNISRTADFVGMERSALHRKLKTLGLAGAREAGEQDAS